MAQEREPILRLITSNTIKELRPKQELPTKLIGKINLLQPVHCPKWYVHETNNSKM